MVSTANIIIIGVGLAALAIGAYYNLKLLQEDSPLGQEARSLLGLDKPPGARILQDPRIANYQTDTHFGGYQNASKGAIELLNSINNTLVKVQEIHWLRLKERVLKGISVKHKLDSCTIH